MIWYMQDIQRPASLGRAHHTTQTYPQHWPTDADIVNVEAPDMLNRDPRDDLPDVRDGLTHRERIVLQCLMELQEERGGRHVPTGMLYGTVVEYVDMSVEEMQSILVRLIGHPLRS